MNIILIIAAIAAALAVLVYCCYRYRSTINEIREVRSRRWKEESVLVDQYPDIAAKRQAYCPESWTDEPRENLYKRGYIKVDKFKDQLRYAGVPVFIKLHGFTVIDLSDPETAKKYGFDNPVKIGSAEQHDFLKSTTLTKFMAGFTRVGFAPIDMKMMLMIAPIALGLILGMAYFLGVFK